VLSKTAYETNLKSGKQLNYCFFLLFIVVLKEDRVVKHEVVLKGYEENSRQNPKSKKYLVLENCGT